MVPRVPQTLCALLPGQAILVGGYAPTPTSLPRVVQRTPRRASTGPIDVDIIHGRASLIEREIQKISVSAGRLSFMTSMEAVA